MGTSSDLRLDHVLGADGDWSGGLMSLNDREIVYAAAGRIVFHDVVTHSQRFLQTGDGSILDGLGEITAMAINAARDLVGVAEKGSGAVKIYSTETLRGTCQLEHESQANENVIHLSISGNSKCLVLCGPPDYLVSLWDLEKSASYASMRLSAITKREIVMADMSLTNNSLISVIGNRFIRFFKAPSKSGKLTPITTKLKTETQSYRSQAWLPLGELVVGSDRSVLVIGEDGEKKQAVSCNVECIAMYPRGFVVGCQDGSVLVFQRSNKDGPFAITTAVDLKGAIPLSLAVTKAADGSLCDAFCLAKSRSIMKIRLNPSGNDDSETEIVPSLNSSLRAIDSLVPDSGELPIDCCAWTPLVAIGGYDGAIRLFDYDTHRVVLTERLTDQRICSLSFHPSGNFLLVGTPTSVNLYSVLADGLSISWQEDLQQPAVVRFARGGDRFAVVCGVMVQIHDMYDSFRNVSTLQGHSKVIIEATFRGKKDDELIAVGADGVVCLWDINRGVAKTRVVDVTSPGYLTSQVSHDSKYVYVITADCLLKKIDVESGEHVNQAQFKCDPRVELMAQLPSGELVVSSHDGGVELVTFEGDSLDRQPFSNRKMTSIQCTKEGLLIAGDREGFVSVYSYGEMEISRPDYCPLEGISFLSCSDFEAKLAESERLENTIRDMQSEHASNVERCGSTHLSLRGKVEDELELSVGRQRYHINELEEEIRALEAEHLSEMDTLNNDHNVNLATASEDCEKKLAREKRQADLLHQNLLSRVSQHQSQMTELKNGHTRAIDKETRQSHSLITDLNKTNEGLIGETKRLQQESAELEEKLEEDAEKERVALAVSFQNELLLLKDSTKLISNERDILRQRHVTMLEDLKELEAQVASQEEKLSTAEETGAALDTASEADRVAIAELEKTILHLERDICVYSQKNLEISNCQRNLEEARIKVDSDLLNCEREVEEAEREVNERKDELKNTTNVGKQVSIELQGLLMKIDQQKKAKKRSEELAEARSRQLGAIENDIADASTNIEDHKLLKSNLIALSEQFLHGSSRGQSKTVTNAEKLESLDEKIDKLRQTMERKKKSHENEMRRLTRENKVLTKELQNEPSCTGKPLSESKLTNRRNLT